MAFKDTIDKNEFIKNYDELKSASKMGDNYPRPIRSFRLRSDRELDSGEFRRIRIPDFFIASRSNEDGHCHSDACQEPKNCSFHPNTISVKVLGMQIYNFIQK